MFRNLIKTALRTIRKDLGYTIINILGLTIGIASSIFLTMFIIDELSYDRFHTKHERIVRVVSHIQEPDDSFDWAVAQIPMAEQAKQDYPEVEEKCRITNPNRYLLKKGNFQDYENNVVYADSSLFLIFDFKLIKGDPLSCLRTPNTVIITEKLAAKYFGEEDPIGKTLESESGENYEITGIMEEIPSNSHITFDVVISWSSLPDEIGSWGNFGVFTYLLLNEGVDVKSFESKLSELYDTFMAPIFEELGIKIEYELQPVASIHLHSKMDGEASQGGDMSYIYIFSVIALFMLIIASINYMNLATARASRRSKEVGIRKIIGSQRRQLIVQFFTESSVLTLIAFVLSVILIYLLLPSFNEISGKRILFSSLIEAKFLATLLGILIIISLLSGIYPAFFLSGYKAVDIFKGKLDRGNTGISLRKILVISQFAISIVMVISTLVVYDQIAFMKNKDLGFDKENLIRLEMSSSNMMQNSKVFKDELRKLPEIVQVGSTNSKLGEGSSKVIFQVETNEGMKARGINFAMADYDFIETLGIEVLEGRDFDRAFRSDSTLGVLVNESLAKRFNWENPLGKKIQINPAENEEPARVVGLLKDYNQTGIYNPIETLMLILRGSNPNIYVKYREGTTQETLSAIKTVWTRIFEDIPFEYTFLENDFNQQFQNDEKRGVILSIFAILTVLIACLGLFGLSSYTVEQRSKEIGIRKVLGSSESQVIKLISRQFLSLVSIAVIIAMPLAWYFTDNWLREFVYRTNFNMWIYVFTLIISLGITFLTIFYHAITAARANPAETLKEE